jgi:hypothetical protein
MTTAQRRSVHQRLALVAALLLPPACSDDRCEQDLERVASCDRSYSIDMCETAETRCAVHCDAKLDCAEYTYVDRDEPPEWWQRCRAKCQERFECASGAAVLAAFVCDGSEDCADGSDELRCTYHVCASGQRVRDGAACDDYAHCADGSDEEGCP